MNPEIETATDAKKRRWEKLLRWLYAAKSTRMNRHAAAWKLQRSKGHRKQLRYQKGATNA